MVYCVLFFYVLNIVMLFMAALGIVPSNIFYTLHIVTFLSAIGGVFVSYTMPLNKLLRYGYIFIAVAFNPFLRFSAFLSMRETQVSPFSKSVFVTFWHD